MLVCTLSTFVTVFAVGAVSAVVLGGLFVALVMRK